MTDTNQTLIEDTNKCRFSQSLDAQMLLLEWKTVPGLLVEDFADGISQLAEHCQDHKPSHVVIDARKLDQDSAAVAWLRGEGSDANGDSYQTWWMRDIVPAYNTAGIISLAVATGDPNAPGELPEIPPGVDFRIGYYHDLASAVDWRPK